MTLEFGTSESIHNLMHAIQRRRPVKLLYSPHTHIYSLAIAKDQRDFKQSLYIKYYVHRFCYLNINNMDKTECSLIFVCNFLSRLSASSPPVLYFIDTLVLLFSPFSKHCN